MGYVASRHGRSGTGQDSAGTRQRSGNNGRSSARSAARSRTNSIVRGRLDALAGRNPSQPARSSRCFTCSSVHRDTIDRLVAEGIGYTEIARRVSDAELRPHHIREHAVRDHAGVRGEVTRRLVQATGVDGSAAMELGVIGAIEKLGEAVAVVRAADARIGTGRTTPTVAQALRSARHLAEYDLAFGEARRLESLIDHVESALLSVLELVRDEVPPPSWSAILRAMDQDRELRLYLPPARSERTVPDRGGARSPESAYRRGLPNKSRRSARSSQEPSC